MPKSIRSFSVGLETQARLQKIIETKSSLNLLSSLRAVDTKLDSLKLLPCVYSDLLAKAGVPINEAQKVQDCDDFKLAVGRYLTTPETLRIFNKELRAAQRWSAQQITGGVRGTSQSSVVEALLILGMDTLEERSAACRQKAIPCEK